MTTERMALTAKVYRTWAGFQLGAVMIALYYATTLDGTWGVVSAAAGGFLAMSFTNTVVKAAALYTAWAMRVEIDKRISE